MSWDPTFIPSTKWGSYYSSQLRQQRFGTIALFFPVSDSPLPSAAAQTLFSGSLRHIRRELLRIVAFDPRVPGLYDLARAIESDPAYRVAEIVPYTGTLSGDYVLWHLLSR